MRALLRRKQGLSIDEVRLVVFIIRCARLMYLLPRLEKHLPMVRRIAPTRFKPALDKFRPQKFVLPPEEQLSPELLLRLIQQCKKLLPWGWTPSGQKIPRTATEFGWQFFLAVTALRLNGGQILRAGHADALDAVDEVYRCLFEIGEGQQAKKKQLKVEDGPQ